jgi:hypothetical protein
MSLADDLRDMRAFAELARRIHTIMTPSRAATQSAPHIPLKSVRGDDVALSTKAIGPDETTIDWSRASTPKSGPKDPVCLTDLSFGEGGEGGHDSDDGDVQHFLDFLNKADHSRANPDAYFGSEYAPDPLDRLNPFALANDRDDGDFWEGLGVFGVPMTLYDWQKDNDVSSKSITRL